MTWSSCPAGPALWIPACAGMTVGFAKVSIKGEGDSVGCVVLFARVTRRPSGLRIKSAMTVRDARMTGRDMQI